MPNPPPQMERWTTATIGELFRVAAAASIYPDLRIKYEAQDEPIPTAGQWIEVRMDGPDSRELSKDYWHFRAEINIIISTIMTDDEFHNHPDLTGHVRSWFPKCFPLYKFGNRPGDDENAIVGIYKRDNSFRNPIELANFGQVDPKIRLVQSTVEGHYDLKEMF